MRPPLSLMPALPAAVGIIAGISLSAVASPLIVGASAAVVSVVAFWRHKHYIAYTALMAMIGALLWHFSAEPPIDASFLERKTSISGTVKSAEMKDYGYACVVKIDKIDGASVSPATCYVQLRDFMPSPPRSGSKVAFSGTISAIPADPDIPGDAYHPSWLLRNGICHQIYYVPGTWMETDAPTGLCALANYMRASMFRAIVNSPISGASASFLIATILGDDYFMNEDTTLSYRQSGTAHVLALSGMHVAILAMLAMALLFPMRLINRGHIYGQSVIIPLAWLFALATGLSPSVVRASAMLSIVIFNRMMQRVSSPFNAVCIAAVLILAASPRSLFAPGFQLSFCAVISILIFNQIVPLKMRKHKFAFYIISLFMMPVAAIFGTGLLSAYHFHIFPLSFLFGNIVMALAFPLLLGGGFILMLLTMVGCKFAILGYFIDTLLSAANNCIGWISELVAALSIPFFSAWAFVPYALAAVFFALAIYRLRNGQPYRWSVAVFACALTVTVVTAGCSRPTMSQAAYLTKGSQPMLLVCQKQSVSVMSLSPMIDDTQASLIAQRRFSATARLYGHDSIAMLRHSSVGGECQIEGNHLLIGDKLLRIFDGNSHTRSPMPVDYAVITQGFTRDIANVTAACSPDTIILCGDIPISRRKMLIKQCGDTIPCIDLYRRTVKISI